MSDLQASASTSHPKVLISYSHDSPEHARQVLELSNRLRRDGIDCTIDQYLLVPPKGWLQWMEQQIAESDFVLMVTTATYSRRVAGKEQFGVGRGVRWEGRLIYQEIYESDTNTKFIPVLFEGGDPEHIAAPLRNTPFYRVQTETGYEDLYRRLSNQPRAIPVELGRLRSLPPFEQKSEGAVARLHHVPDLPPHFLPRAENLTPLRDALLSDRDSPVGVTSTLKAVGVQGMGGIGKTVLASAMAHDPEVRRAFPDGIYWVTVGREPNLVGLQMELAESLTGDKPNFTTAAKGKDTLRRALEDRRALIILDDVWHLDHGDALVVGVPPSRTLITTRNAEVLVGLGAREHRLDVLSPADALAMLADWAGVPSVEKLPREAAAIAKECGYLPLALSMIGAMLRLQPAGWADALANLQCADLEEIKRTFTGYPYPDLFKAIDVSVEGLEPADRERYLDLAVFPEDQTIPDSALQPLWRLDGRKTRACMGRLTARSLASAISETGTVVAIRLHDLQGDLIRKRREPELPQLHQRLLDGWGDLVKLPDAYAWRRVAYHLIHAGRKAELRRLLSDLRWMRAKLKATDLSELIVEYNWLADDGDLALVQGALRLAQVLWQDPAQMPGQLLARLSGKSPGVAAVRESIATWEEEPWLQPLRPLLTPPGTALLLTLAGHAGPVLDVQCGSDGELAASGSADGTVKIWKLNPGRIERTLTGHADWVRKVVFVPGTSTLLSASDDCTLRLWNLNTGRQIACVETGGERIHGLAVLPDGRAMTAHGRPELKVWDVRGERLSEEIITGTAPVRVLAVAADGQRLAAAATDGTLAVWRAADLKKIAGCRVQGVAPVCVAFDGENHLLVVLPHGPVLRWDFAAGSGQTRTLPGESFFASAVAVASRSRRIAIGSEYAFLDVLEADAGRSSARFEGHTGPINAVTIDLTGGRAISASDDQTIRVWDLHRGSLTRIRGTHRDPVAAIGFSADGAWAFSTSDFRELKVWNPSTLEVVKSITGYRAWLVEDGRGEAYAVWAPAPGSLHCWRVGNLPGAATLVRSRRGMRGFSVNVGDQFVLGCDTEGPFTIWDPTGLIALQINLESQSVRHFAVSQSGRRLATYFHDGMLRTTELDENRRVVFRSAAMPELSTLALAANGAWLASHGSNQNICIRSMFDDAEVRLGDQISGITALALSDCGDRLAGSAEDGTVRVWDVVNASLLAVFTGENAMRCAAWQPGSNLLAAGDESGLVHFLRLRGVPPSAPQLSSVPA